MTVFLEYVYWFFNRSHTKLIERHELDGLMPVQARPWLCQWITQYCRVSYILYCIKFYAWKLLKIHIMYTPHFTQQLYKQNHVLLLLCEVTIISSLAYDGPITTSVWCTFTTLLCYYTPHTESTYEHMRLTLSRESIRRDHSTLVVV